MPKKQIWKPKTRFKIALHQLTRSWGVQKAVAVRSGVASSSLSAWADTNNHALPNVEQAYFIAEALEQNLLEMIGGNVQLPAPRLPDRIARAVRLLMQLPPEQQRLVVDTIEAFAKTAGLADAEHKQERAG